MGCFLACFGYSKKRKQYGKLRTRIISEVQVCGSYEPLQPEVMIACKAKKNCVSSDSEFREKLKDRLSSKIKKKVTFSLNVKTYEPIPNEENNEYSLDCKEEKETWEKTREAAKPPISLSNCGDSRMVTYSSNYRYQKCSDSYDEDDEIRIEESDLDDDELSNTSENDDCDSNYEEDDGLKTCNFVLTEQYYCQTKGSKEVKASNAQVPAEKGNNITSLDALSLQELKKFEGNSNVRDRSMYVHSVLNPVENLTQWKAIKARAIPPVKHQKENSTTYQERKKPLNTRQEIAVDASLTNWLASSSEKGRNILPTKRGH